jgi:uncharacterized protein (DUF1684 family)
MKQLKLLIVLFLLSYNATQAQKTNYNDSIQKFQDKYVKEHGVVEGKDKSNLHFFPINEQFKIKARFERIYSASWFNMETSGKTKKPYRVYGVLHFTLKDTVLKLNVYQSQQLMATKEYADHLFVPFTDKTSGDESYDNGRYIDILEGELKGENYTIDFNKAYNPYCAYVSNVYNCPVPPKENDLSVFIRAGEMKFGKSH